MTRLRALLWDVDGTIAETERDGHRVAFNLAFDAWGLPWHWDETRYGELLRVTGGRERILHDMSTRADAPASPADRDELARALHANKNAIYGKLVRDGGMPLRDGVLELMRQCRARDLRMGIATTTSRANVEVLLHAALGEHWDDWFAAIVCGEDVARKKPDPEVYLRALESLGTAPDAAAAIEDSPNGVDAARAAGIPVIVTRSAYFVDAKFEGALAVGPGFDSRRYWQPPTRATNAGDDPVRLADIENWHARSATITRPICT
ncbi:MAG: HAD-IA family hydrolase [Betaproteobacteria bacterium]